ncbi:MAG TPA: VWA domain-containing protein [Vicinamibacterales bacterium]|nr:VWA domain-containing protein [Vicinamibacterales bacterium]
MNRRTRFSLPLIALAGIVIAWGGRPVKAAPGQTAAAGAPGQGTQTQPATSGSPAQAPQGQPATSDPPAKPAQEQPATARPAPGQAAAGQQPPQVPFRAGVELVSLNVTVTDGTQKYITDLTQDDFNVFEDGVKQDVTFFNKTNLPIALALLLDTSASMESKLPTAQEAAIGFARKLRSHQDLAEIIDFDSRVIVLQNFTNSVAELEQAIHKTSAGGSTSLYNAIYIALKDLKKIIAKNTEEIRRQAIIVLSDGEDTSSLLPFEEVLDLAKRSETAIYSIGLRTPDGPGTTTKGFKEAEFVLRQFSQETGGRAFFPNQLADLANVYGQIADELSSQYTVGYTSRNPKRDGSWRRIVVRVGRPNLIARTKLGYFAPTAH